MQRTKRAPPTRQVNFRLPADVWARLAAMAGVLGQTQSRIVSDALQTYFRTLPSTTRQTIEQAMALRQKH